MTAKAAQPYFVEPAGKLPNSARNVQFGFFCEWIAITDVIRFEATPEDCVATAEKWIADYNAKNPKTRVRGIRPLADALRPEERDDGVVALNTLWAEPPSTDPFKASWFKPQEIKERIAGGGERLLIWVDTMQGVFYYRFSD